MNTVFKPQDFRLLRRPCKRYPAEQGTKVEKHTAGPLVTGVHSAYQSGIPGGLGACIGVGCFRSTPRFNR